MRKDYGELSLRLHEEHHGKIELKAKMPVENHEDLSIVYTPGVAEPCRKIALNREEVYRYTSKGNMVAVVTDGTAVLGLGDIGPEAALPVMEGKCILFKRFANIDAVPICLNTKDPDEIVNVIDAIAPSFGGINLEDISAPRCFEIERRLKNRLSIPVFHDDQHGTAIVLLASLINALKLVDKKAEEVRIVVSGAGSAGVAIGKLLLNYGCRKITYCDRKGILSHRTAVNDAQHALCDVTNLDDQDGTLADAMKNADVFIGVSAPDLVTAEMVQSMNLNPILFPMANPVPEISYEAAKAAGAAVVGTGRSDCPNQINNVLVFPGIFRGALDCKATAITEEMKLAAARALANIVRPEELSADYIIPSVFNPNVTNIVAGAVMEIANRQN